MIDELAALRAEAQRLEPGVEGVALAYLAGLAGLPDVWVSALTRDLEARAAGAPPADLDDLVTRLGRPGAWLPASVAHAHGWPARLFLAAVVALAEQCRPPGRGRGP